MDLKANKNPPVASIAGSMPTDCLCVAVFAMVLELLNRGSLEEKLAESPKRRISEAQIETMAGQILSALAHMHKVDVIHRDIKPANIMLHLENDDEEGGQVCYKLIDFSVAALDHDEGGKGTLQQSTTERAAFVGTPHYMSPEQFDAELAVGPQTDLWSLGVVMYECLSGKKPFAQGVTDHWKILNQVVSTDHLPQSLIEATDCEITRGMCDFVERAIEKDFSQRYQSASAMAEDLGKSTSSTPYLVVSRPFVTGACGCR